MKKNILWIGVGTVTLSIALLTVARPSAAVQERQEGSSTVKVERIPLEQSEDAWTRVEALTDPETQQITVFDGDEGPSWLGVETHEVTPEDAKQLKLPAERGVVVAGVTKDSPAAKAGLRENDVITEVNGQRVEGAAQFRRMIHEIPAGRGFPILCLESGFQR